MAVVRRDWVQASWAVGAIIMMLTLAAACTASDPEPVVLSDEEMTAAFEARATGYHDAIIPVITEVIREFDDGLHGNADSLSISRVPSLSNEMRMQELCEELVGIESAFDAEFEGVEHTPRHDELRTLHDGLPDVAEPAVVIALVSEGMISIDGYPVLSEFILDKRFPDPYFTYNDVEVSSSGELDGWKVSTVNSFVVRSFYNDAADCFFDALESQQSN